MASRPVVLFVAGLATALALAASAPYEPVAEQRQIAVTVDDLPVAPPRWHDVSQQVELTEELLAALAAHDVPAVGFVNEGRLEDEEAVRDPRLVALLERWLEAGHELGNHGHSHLDLHRVGPDEWMADVLRGERVTRPLVEARDGMLRWFRHPFLHTGRSVEIQARTEPGQSAVDASGSAAGFRRSKSIVQLGAQVAPRSVLRTPFQR